MRLANEPLSRLQMIELYRIEKAALDDPLEPFPMFADWKKEYCDEFTSRSHHRKPVDLETLIKETDREVEEADLVLQTDEGETTMTDTNVNVDQAKRDARNAKRREQRAAAKAASVTSTASPKVRAARTGTKSEAAAKIFASMYPAHPRSEIIAKFQSKVGLSPAGSSTYYQKLLSKAKA